MIRMSIDLVISEEGMTEQEMYEKWKAELEKIGIRIGISECEFEEL